MSPQFTIIVPLYNNELYISECIESVLNQSYDDFELIIIDDGSTDSSSAICEGYEKNDCRIKYKYQQNGGVSKARNAGLSLATGKWVTFLDSDDSLTKHTLSTVKEIIDKETCIDLIQVSSTNSIQDIPLQRAESYIKNPNLRVNACGSFYKKSIIDDKGIRFIEGLKLGEDQLFTFEFLIHAKYCIRLKYLSYNYRIHSASSTHNPDFESIKNTIQCAYDFKYRSVFDGNISDLILSLLIAALRIHGIKSKVICDLTYGCKLHPTQVFIESKPWVKLLLVRNYLFRLASIAIIKNYLKSK